MTLSIPTDALFVPTDEQGRQFHDDEVTFWSVPEGGENGTVVPGRIIEAAAGGVRMLDLDHLLDQLGARIFVASQAGGEPTLAAETMWSLRAAAAFALDCAEHVLGTAGGPPAEITQTLADVVAASRKWLAEAADADTGLLGRFSRLATARRLRRQGDQLGALALDLAVDAEAADLDILDDASWTAVAATRDAVLAAVEAVRHDAAPHLTEGESARYEEGGAAPNEPASGTFDTPWGPFRTGLRKGVVPAWVAATEAAERARRSVEDAAGAEAAALERAWQLARLAQALRGE